MVSGTKLSKTNFKRLLGRLNAQKRLKMKESIDFRVLNKVQY